MHLTFKPLEGFSLSARSLLFSFSPGLPTRRLGKDWVLSGPAITIPAVVCITFPSGRRSFPQILLIVQFPPAVFSRRFFLQASALVGFASPACDFAFLRDDPPLLSPPRLVPSFTTGSLGFFGVNSVLSQLSLNGVRPGPLQRRFFTSFFPKRGTPFGETLFFSFFPFFPGPPLSPPFPLSSPYLSFFPPLCCCPPEMLILLTWMFFLHLFSRRNISFYVCMPPESSKRRGSCPFPPKPFFFVEFHQRPLTATHPPVPVGGELHSQTPSPSLGLFFFLFIFTLPSPPGLSPENHPEISLGSQNHLFIRRRCLFFFAPIYVTPPHWRDFLECSLRLDLFADFSFLFFLDLVFFIGRGRRLDPPFFPRLPFFFF